MYGYEEHIDLTPTQVLQKVKQEEVFEWILGKPFDLKEKYTSVFRQDKNPGCKFDKREDGTILFIDFGEKDLSGHTHRSIFMAVQDYFQVSLSTAIRMICERYGLSTNSQDYNKVEVSRVFNNRIEDTIDTVINVDQTHFVRRDILHWSQFLIKPEEMLEDNVYPINRFSIKGKNGFSNVRLYGPAYCMDFIDKKKIYQPYSKDFKWISNCDENCIGNIDNLPPSGEELIIKKSYKDHRVLRNLIQGLNVIWFHNEGCVPSMDILVNLVSRFKLITIFFDNDMGGTLAAMKLVEIFNSIRKDCARMIHLPIWIDRPSMFTYKDPSQLVSKEGRRDSIILLNQLGIYGKDT